MTAAWTGSAHCSTRRLTIFKLSFSRADLATTLQRPQWCPTGPGFTQTRIVGSYEQSILGGHWAQLQICRVREALFFWEDSSRRWLETVYPGSAKKVFLEHSEPSWKLTLLYFWNALSVF